MSTYIMCLCFPQLHEQAAAEAKAHRGSTGVRQHLRYKPGVVVNDAV